MSALEDVCIEMTVVLGSTRLPIRQMLKIGRGAMIPLDCGCDDPTEIHVNGTIIAKGQIKVSGDRMAIEVTELVKRKA